MGAAVARAHITMNLLGLLGAAALVVNALLVVTELIGTWRTVDEARGLLSTATIELSAGWPWVHLAWCTVIACGVVLTGLYGAGYGATTVRSLFRDG